MRVSLNHLDKVVVAGSELEGRMCRTARKKISVLWLVRVQSGRAVSLLGSRKRNKDADTADPFLDLFLDSRTSVCLKAWSLSRKHTQYNSTLTHY